jgi:hypothetical protein
MNSQWDTLDGQTSNVASAMPVQNGHDRESERTDQLPSPRNLDGVSGWTKRRAQGEEGKLLAEAYLGRLRESLQAQGKHDRALIDLKLDKALASIRDELFSYLETLGLEQAKRRCELTLKLEQVVTEWLRGILERDMPEFMRQTQLKAVQAFWVKQFQQIMKAGEGE